MYLVDANIILELQLDQKKADECGRLLEAVRKGKIEAYITDLTLDSILIIMEDMGKTPSELELFLVSLTSFRGLRIYFLSLMDRLEAIGLMRRFRLDFEDSTLAHVARRLGVESLISFDKHFDGIKDLHRVEPSELSIP